MLFARIRANRSIHALTLGAILASTALTGCATTNRYGQDYSNDVCHVERDKLQESGNHFAEDIAAGVVKGAVAGMVVGGLTAAMTGRNIGAGLAVGAIAGAVTGFAAGYYNNLVKQEGGQPNAVIGIFQADVEHDAEALAKTQAAFDSLMACRRQEIASVQTAVRNGSLPRDQGEAKMAEIRKKISEDVTVARSIMNNIEDRNAQYAVAGAKLGVPGAEKQAEVAYAKKVKSGAKVDRPDLKADEKVQITKSDAKKVGASFTNYTASVDHFDKSVDVAEKLASGSGMSELPDDGTVLVAAPVCPARAI